MKFCINCGDTERARTTPYFNGSISLFMPSVSWVARWNNLEGYRPGVYAVSVIDSEQVDEDFDGDMGTTTKTKKKKRSHNVEEIIYSDQDPNEFYD
jgi:hypothetical protein